MAIEDASGNIETGDTTTKISLAIGSNPSGGTLTGGSAVTVVSGTATFAGLSIDKVGTGYTLTASSTPAYTPATSTAFNITPGPSNTLAFIQNPTTTAAGSTMTPAVTVAVEDSSGNIETGDNSTTVALAFGNNPGVGTLTGGSAVTVISGVATFSGVSINKTGTGYTLTASSTPSFTVATSTSFDITPGTATKLAFTQGPSNAQAGSAISPAVTVAVEDANGNIETGDNGTQVTLTLANNPGSGHTHRRRPSDRFVGCCDILGAFCGQGGLWLHAQRCELSVLYGRNILCLHHHTGRRLQVGVHPAAHEYRNRHGHQPSGLRRRRGRQRQYRDVDSATQVTLAIGANPAGGSLTGGSAMTVFQGVATFSVLTIDKPGNGYTLSATSSPAYAVGPSSTIQCHEHGKPARIHPATLQRRRPARRSRRP